MKNSLQLSSILFLFILVSCSSSPTGRKQLLLLSEGTMSHMGQEAFKEMKAKLAQEKSLELNQRVQCVTKNLLQGLPQKEKLSSWEVVVFKDDAINAFALPGKKVGVFTGLVNFVDSNGQLAAVIAHEISHVLSHHANERVSQTFVVQGGLDAVNLALGGAGQSHDLLMAALGVGAQIGVLLPYNRRQEKEADLLGLEIMARAGMDPREAVNLWEKMGRSKEKTPPEFLSTHPAPGSRVNYLSKAMKGDLLKLYKKNKNKLNPCSLVVTKQ